MEYDIDKIKEHLKQYYPIGTKLAPRSYILPDGDVLEIVGTDGHGYHGHVSYKLERDGIVEDDYTKKHGADIMEDLGCIRVNMDREGFIALASKKPTPAQYGTLNDTLYEYFNGYKLWSLSDYKPYLRIYTPHSKGFEFKKYSLIENTPEDIIQVIKNYYKFGALIESINRKVVDK